MHAPADVSDQLEIIDDSIRHEGLVRDLSEYLPCNSSSCDQHDIIDFFQPDHILGTEYTDADQQFEIGKCY